VLTTLHYSLGWFESKLKSSTKEEDLMRMKQIFTLTALVLSLTACKQQPITAAEKESLAKPVDCATAQSDLQVLQSEKATTEQKIKDGVVAVFPIGLVVNVAKGTEGDSMKVATGDYNKMIDTKISEIKAQCNIQ
jgi:hypothetical protein